MIMPTWDEKEMFKEFEPLSCPPELPRWATTKEEMEEEAVEIWNKRTEESE